MVERLRLRSENAALWPARAGEGKHAGGEEGGLERPESESKWVGSEKTLASLGPGLEGTVVEEASGSGVESWVEEEA